MAAAAKRRLDTTLAAAVAHPIRSRALVILAEREASPSEIAKELNLDVPKVGYHVTALVEANLIELTRTRPVRGTIEHFYRAAVLPYVDSDQEAERSEEERRVYGEAIWSIATANAAHSFHTGTYVDRSDHYTTRFAFNVDEQGWLDASAAHAELEARIFEIQKEAAERMLETDEKPLRAVNFQAWFEVPRTAKD